MRSALLMGMVGMMAKVSGGVLAAETAGTIPGQIDWPSLLDKGTTVGILLWIVIWYQRRSDTDKAQMQTIAERSVAAQVQNAEAIQHVAESQTKLSAAIESLTSNLRK